MLKIVVSCMKGGEGKTLIAAILARIYAYFSLRVLVIDMDMQHHLSGNFLKEKNTHNVCKGLMNRDLNSEIIKGLLPNIDLIQSSWGLIDLRAMSKGALADSLKTIPEDAYDICILDTPGNYDNVVIASLFASDICIHPIGIDSTGALEPTFLRNKAVQADVPEALSKQFIVFNKNKGTKISEEYFDAYSELDIPWFDTRIPYSDAQIRDAMDKRDFMEKPAAYHLIYPAMLSLAREILLKLNKQDILNQFEQAISNAKGDKNNG